MWHIRRAHRVAVRACEVPVPQVVIDSLAGAFAVLAWYIVSF
jgi:hypothetical protein